MTLSLPSLISLDQVRTRLGQALHDLRQKKPLILNLTNKVTMDFIANTLLALGAAPVMSECEEELEEFISCASAVSLNIGTLNPPFIALIQRAASLAAHAHKPVVLDPVGAGASRLRTQTAQALLPFSTVLRGNASEIIALADLPYNPSPNTSSEKGSAPLTKGVEAVHTTAEARTAATQMAHKGSLIVVVSGAIDEITDGEEWAYLSFGDPLMTAVTGMGCALSAVIAAFCAVSSSPFEASVLGTAYFGLCGGAARQHHSAPGSFKNRFLDELYTQSCLDIPKIS